jgi:predicted phosphodiesterase
MLYGVFSDVHSNREALDAVLTLFEDSGVEGYLCCGDLVGYGPEPEYCLERVRALKNLSVICGNHDLGVLGRLELDWFNPYARAAALWTRDAISQDSRRWLEGLTARLDAPEFTLVHGTPRRPAEEYLLNAAQFRENISGVKVWPLFMGHSHMPIVFRQAEEGIQTLFMEDQQQLSIERKPFGVAPIAFNPGSVGQPRDQDKRACCALYDSEAGTYRVLRVPYDIAGVQRKIRDAGLPEYLALRLAYGQ